MNKIKFELLASKENEGDRDCHGFIFKGKNNSFWDGKSFRNQQSLYLLKRDACKCKYCVELLNADYFNDLMSESMDCIYWNKIVDTSEIQNDKYYQMEITELSEYGFEFNIHGMNHNHNNKKYYNIRDARK